MKKRTFAVVITLSDMTIGKTKTLQEHAMRFGTLMGIFWILKFILLPLGFKIPFLQLLFIMLTCYVPFLGYKMVKKYRNDFCEGTVNFSQAYLFLMMMYFFAALLTSAGHFTYFQFIDNGFITDSYLSSLETFKNGVSGGSDASVDQLIEMFNQVAALSPIQLTLQLFIQNIFYGSLLALPTALLAMKRKKQI